MCFRLLRVGEADLARPRRRIRLVVGELRRDRADLELETVDRVDPLKDFIERGRRRPGKKASTCAIIFAAAPGGRTIYNNQIF